jgi:hypothetical protein
MTEIFDFPILASGKMDLAVYTDRQKIEIIEWIMLNTMENIADDLPVREFLHGGIYERELTIPAGTVLTGKIHTKDHMFHLTKGDLSVMTDDGVKRIQAPARLDVTSGGKKIGYAHTDVVCTTFTRTDLTDLDEIEKETLSDSDLSWVYDLFDFKKFLIEFNFDENKVYEISRNESDLMFTNNDNIEVKESKIQGKGVFSLSKFLENEFIAHARTNDKRDAAGRYTNHSKNPNAKMIRLKNNDLDLVAIKTINQGDEITIDYREAILCQA